MLCQKSAWLLLKSLFRRNNNVNDEASARQWVDIYPLPWVD